MTILLFFPNFQHMLHSYFSLPKTYGKTNSGGLLVAARQSHLGMENRRRECCPGSSEVNLEYGIAGFPCPICILDPFPLSPFSQIRNLAE